MEDDRRYGDFEATDSVRFVLDAYDPASDRWRLAFDGPFWKAVDHAHGLGFDGRGHTVALIDSGCDRRIASLGQRVRRFEDCVGDGSDEDDPLGHGTAVALLLSKVAPRCTIDVYRVATDDGRVDLHATIDAIEAASDSDAKVICLSLGEARPLEAPSDLSVMPALNPLTLKQEFAAEDPPCRLCQASARAAERGKLVFAAVGNSIIDHYCPSRRPEVFAIGFQRQIRLDHGGGHFVGSGMPLTDEAPYSDFFVEEINSIRGSSFACPHYAGVGALGVSPAEIAGYRDAFALSASPKRKHAQMDMMGVPLMTGPRLPGSEVALEYLEAFRQLPHAHCAVKRAINPESAPTEARSSPFCGIFAEALYVKVGLWFYQAGQFGPALHVLDAACAFAPWSAEAFLNRGLVYDAMRQRGRADEDYRAAYQRDPRSPSILDTLRRVRGQAPGPA